jgi:hypothetical protein
MSLVDVKLIYLFICEDQCSWADGEGWEAALPPGVHTLPLLLR